MRMGLGAIVCIVQIHEKQHRGPKVLWPLGRALTSNALHFPHWAQRIPEAIDRWVFDTTVLNLREDPPPSAGVREPRRPQPTAPAGRRATPLDGSDA